MSTKRQGITKVTLPWILFTTLGWLLTLAVGSLMVFVIFYFFVSGGDNEYYIMDMYSVTILITFLFSGTVMGIFQQKTIRSWLPHADNWILITGIGLPFGIMVFIGLFVLFSLTNTIPNNNTPVFIGIISGTVLGIILGTAQWFTLNKDLGHKGLIWIPGNIVGWAFSSALAISPIFTSYNITYPSVQYLMGVSILSIIPYSLITGSLLGWLLVGKEPQSKQSITRGSHFAIYSLVLGILSLLPIGFEIFLIIENLFDEITWVEYSLLVLLPILCILLSLSGIIVGVIAIRKNKKAGGQNTIAGFGIALCVLPWVTLILFFCLFINAILHFQ
jgi:hypothetical protein